MREIRTSGSEGGGGVNASPYPYRKIRSNAPRHAMNSRAPIGSVLACSSASMVAR